jgi:hypothetical protein
MKRSSHSDSRLFFLKRPMCFPPTVVADVKGLYPRCEGQLNFLE